MSPSQVGRYFFHHCERFFRFSATTYACRKGAGIPEREFEQSSVMRQVLKEGNRWEEIVLEQYLSHDALIADGDGPFSKRNWNVEDSLKLFRDAPVGSWIYQPTLRVPRAFYEKYRIDPALVLLSDCRPDLVWVSEREGRRCLVVTDVKRGESLRSTYRVQVLLYALMLDSLVEEMGIDTDVATDRGGVWLGGNSEATICDLSQLTPHLVEFLREEMPKLLQPPANTIPWHVQYRCEWCEYHSHCDAEMREEGNVSELTRLSSYGKKFMAASLGVRTLTELRSFLNGRAEDVDRALLPCASLAGSRAYLRAKTDALIVGAVESYGSRTELFPRYSDVKVFLTLQWEPIGGTTFLAGMRVAAETRVSPMALGRFGAPGGQSLLTIARSPDEAGEVRREFTLTLHELLAGIDAFNCDREWKEQLSVQVIVYSHSERALLERVLLEALEDEPDVAEAAMSLLLFLATPELIHLGEQPHEDPIGNPVTVLLDGLSRLFALPVPVSYTLPEALEAFGVTSYERNDELHFPLGHALRSDLVHDAWFSGEDEKLDEFEAHADAFLSAVETLFREAYREASERGLLEDWPPKFRLPSSSDLRDPVLARLAFFAKYESMSRCLAVRMRRDQPLDVQAATGGVLELVAQDSDGRFSVVRGTMDVEQSNWGNWLLVPATTDGRAASRSFPDFYARGPGVYRLKNHPSRGVVKLNTVTHDPLGAPIELKVGFVKPLAESAMSPGDRYLLYERFSDYTTDRLIDFLSKLDDAPPGLFRDLLDDPDLGAQQAPLAVTVAKILEEVSGQVELPPSKAVAFDAICSQRVTVVWGPPGTGKTYFLAATICLLQEAHRRAGQPFHVLVTAFTHAAIENLLTEICKVADELGLVAPVCKLGGWQRAAVGKAISGKNALQGYQAEHRHSIVGTTVYQLAKEDRDVVAADLLVVDEASQVRVPEAAIPTAYVASNGRMIFAGDDFQLPPIVAGTYSEPGQGPALHRSIFEALLRRDDTGSPTSTLVHQLQENYRMNDVLTSLASTCR